MGTDVTTINGTALSSFGAALLSYDTGALSFKNNYFKSEKRLQPTIFAPNMPLREVVLKCEFFAQSDGIAESHATNLAFHLTQNSDIYLPDGFYYTGTLTKVSKPKRIAAGIFTREFGITAYRHGALESITLTQSGTVSVNIKGNYKTAVRYKISTSGTTFSVNGITVEGITGDLIVIDGINCTVTEDGENCFEKTNATEFPTLEAGENDIVIDGSGTVVIEYYPIYF